jgi:hypothetical protein
VAGPDHGEGWQLVLSVASRMERLSRGKSLYSFSRFLDISAGEVSACVGNFCVQLGWGAWKSTPFTRLRCNMTVENSYKVNPWIWQLMLKQLLTFLHGNCNKLEKGSF